MGFRKSLKILLLIISLTINTFKVIANESRIVISTIPQLGTTNLLVNGDFEQGQITDYWKFDGLVPENFSSVLSSNAISGQSSLYLRAIKGRYSGYWRQNVEIVPGEELLLSFWADVEYGRTLCYVVGNDKNGKHVFDHRKYLLSLNDNPLYPAFVKQDYLKDPATLGWGKYRLSFKNQEDAIKASVYLGIYFRSGAVYFDNVYFGPPSVQMSVKVQNNPQLSVKRLLILDDTATIIYDSGVFETPLAEIQTEFEIPADSSFYEIFVYDIEGNETIKRYFASR